MIAYVSIGNSDDKLAQREWSEFVRDVDRALDGTHVHGRWFSGPDVPWQSACWCFELSYAHINRLHQTLARLAAKYRQDSIAWAQAPVTEFIKSPRPNPANTPPLSLEDPT